MEPDFIGLRDGKGGIHLKHIEPDGCLATWRNRLALWLGRALVAAAWFGAGMIVGRCTG